MVIAPAKQGWLNPVTSWTTLQGVNVFSLAVPVIFQRKGLPTEKCFLSAELHTIINLLNPTGHVTHQQFNIQQLYALPTLYLCVLYLSEDKQRLVPLTA